MSAHPHSARYLRDESAVTAAEFAMVLPAVLMFLFAIIDVGWFTWQVNQLEKATQTGARMAVVTDVIATGLTTENYVGKTVGGVTLSQGDRIPAAALGLITCTAASCTCTAAPCPATLGYNGTAFTRIVGRIREIAPAIQPGNVLIQYGGSGLGYAGDPSGLEIAPLVTVRLKDSASTAIGSRMQFRPITLWIFNTTINLPSFSYSLPMEDGTGSVSN